MWNMQFRHCVIKRLVTPCFRFRKLWNILFNGKCIFNPNHRVRKQVVICDSTGEISFQQS